MRTGQLGEAWHSQLSQLSIVYVWGYNGYCRLGLGNQKDVLTPQVVPQVCHAFTLSPRGGFSCGICSLQDRKSNFLVQRWPQALQIL